MAFCTSCGGSVQGSFCPQCGAQVGAQTAAPPQPGTYVAPAVAPAAKRKLGALGWIMIILGSLFVLGMIAVAVFVDVVAHVVKHPETALSALITAANPDAEVLHTDTNSRTMRIRDRKTGEEVTMSFDDIKNGRFKMSAVDKEGKVANVEIGGGAGKMPGWVPTYPGAKVQGNFTARGQDADGMGEGGMVSFTSPDSPAQVISYYEEKCKDMGLAATLNQTTPGGAMFTATDKDSHRSLNIIAAGHGGETSITVTYGRGH